MIFRTLILLTCAVNLGCSVTVELYSGANYSGLLKKAILNQAEENKCIQLDQTYEVRSLKTEKCVMVYETEDCNRIDTKLPEGSKLYSMRVEKDTPRFDIDGAYSNRQEERGVQSFRLCDTEPGAGGLLNVDIYSGPSYTGDLVASFEGVCKCKNIPSYLSNVLKGKPFSIDNHGKNMYFYEKEDCGGQERLIPAGDSERSRSVFNLDTRAVVIRSFRLADLPCPNLDALINKFTFSTGGNFRNWVKKNTTYTITNRKQTTVREYIEGEQLYFAEYTVAKAFTYTRNTRVKAGVLMYSHDGITGSLGKTLASSFEAHYQYPDTNPNTPTLVNAGLTDALTHTPVDTPACTACTVNILADKFQRYPIIYTAEAIVTGVVGEDKMSAEQIRHFLPPGMKYVKKNDDFGVVVTVEGEMNGSKEIHDVEVSCMALADCESSLRMDL